MGYLDGISDDKIDENQTKFSPSDFHFMNNMLFVNKNLKFILHNSQYSDKFTIKMTC